MFPFRVIQVLHIVYFPHKLSYSVKNYILQDDI